MDWADDADETAREILRAHAQQLNDEAERIAQRAEAPGVSPEYVRQAAALLHLRRTSGAADAMLAVGPALATLGGGVGLAQLTSSVSLRLDTWVIGGAYGSAAIGLLVTGAGIALKVRR
jgi:hypothetical protein